MEAWRKAVGALVLMAVGAAGVAALGILFWPLHGRVVTGINDFLPSYAASRLVGTASLYDPVRLRQEEIAVTGWYGSSWHFIRLPFYALFFRPLATIPYRTAYLVWEVLSTAALSLAIAIWPFGPRHLFAVACCWSVPVFLCLINAQDDTFLLLMLVLSVRLYRRYPTATGMLLSLGAAKYHLFLFVPIVFLLHRRWRMAAGFLTGATLLACLSFAVEGHWMRAYLQVVLRKDINPNHEFMPNLHGLLSGVGWPGWWQLFAGLVIAGLVIRTARRSGFEMALATAVAGGLLAGYHAYFQDYVLLFPLLLIAINSPVNAVGRASAWLLATPAPYCLKYFYQPLAATVPIALIVLVAAVAWNPSGEAAGGRQESLRTGRTAAKAFQ